jgi:adenylate cyclase
MREHVAPVRERWHVQAEALDVGIGVAQGEVTLALLRCAGRVDYAMLGPVMELAEGLCDAARPGQMLLSAAVGAAVTGVVNVAPVALPSRWGGPDLGVVMEVLEVP